MKSRSLIARMLHQMADKINDGSCGLDDEELLSISQMLVHRKMDIEQICQYYGISRATLNRWQDKGKLPQFRKDSGGKCYMWLDEAEAAIEKYNEADQ